MKKLKYIITGAMLLLLFNTASSQFLVNKGRNIIIKPLSVLNIQGDYVNLMDGNILCDGTINISGNWTNNAIAGILMEGSTGTVDFRGSQAQTIGGTTPTWFPKLDISQGPGQVKLETDINCDANLTISGRELLLNGNKIHAASYVNVFTNGTFTADSGSVLEMEDGRQFQAMSSATAKFLGSETSPATVRSSSGYYYFKIHNGANFHTEHTIFENMELDGLEIFGNIDPLHAMHHCTFQYGRTDGVLITFNNPNAVTIHDARFPENTWGSNYNVTKLNDEGRITFNEAIGNFAGEWFENDPNNSVDWVNTQMVHEVVLSGGWSGFSSWVAPEELSMETMFASVNPELIFITNLEGIYYPAQNINTIGLWESHAAFIMKMQQESTLTIVAPPELNNVVQLNQGWTLMPVVSPVPLNADELFSGISWTMEIVKEVAGTKVFWPAMGIYTLDEIHPAKSYLVRCTDPIPLLFPTFPPSTGKDGYTFKPATNEVTQHPWNKMQKTGVSHTIGFPQEIAAQFNDGDVIGIFTPEGVCAGVAQVKPQQSFAITAFADDPITAEIEGFATGEPLTFKKYAPDLKEETTIKVIFDQELPDAEGVFTPDGLSVVKEILLEPENISSNMADHQLRTYPNPTSGIFTVTDVSNATQLIVADAKGIKIMKVSPVSKKHIELDLSGQLHGIYFLKVIYPDHTEVKKIMLN